MPAGWQQLHPGDAPQVERVVAELDAQLIAASSSSGWPESLGPNARALLRTVADWCGSLSDAGVILYAWWAELADDHGEPIVLTAAGALAVLHSPSEGTRADGLDALSLLAAGQGTSSDEESRCDLMDINGALALRIVNPSATRASVPGSNDQAGVQYVMPVYGAPAVTILTFVTPSHRFADRMRPMFDAIASTLKVTYRAPESTASPVT
jgi:hypothetical protein